MENNRGLVPFCLGCAVGAVAAVLFAPKSGRETVEYLSQKANEGTDYVKQRVADVRDAATAAVEQGTTAVRSQVENLRAAVDAGQEAYKRAQERTP
jgi:gas vesicle protein